MTVLDDNIAKLNGYLQRFRDTGILNRIAGADVPGAAGVFENITPVDRSVICEVAHGDATDIDAAARAAHAAFTDWRDMPALERKKILIRVAEGIEARAEEIALCECWDTGQTLKFMSKAALRGAENFRYFADQVVRARDGQHLKSPTLMNVTTRVPIGPVGVITPWNTPFMLSTWKIAPAFAARLHGRSQTGRSLAPDGAAAGRDRGRGGSAAGRPEHGQRIRRRRGQGAVRTSADQGDRLCR